MTSPANSSADSPIRNLLAELQTEMEKQDLGAEKQEKGLRYLVNKGKLKQWTGLLGIQALESGMKEQQKMLQAENRGVCQAMGWEYSENENEDMTTTHLGDVHYPAPVVIQAPAQSTPPAKSGLGTIAALLLGMGLPTAGMGGYVLNTFMNAATVEKPPIVQPEFDDESVRLRLLHESDLQNETS